MKILRSTVAFLVVLVVLASCAAGAGSSSAKEGTQYNELADYLRRKPGVIISGNSPNYTVKVRGDVTVSGTDEALFVVDGDQVGNYAQAADLVDPNNIKYVNVLKTVAETQPYGMRGSAGVIVIKTGRKN